MELSYLVLFYLFLSAFLAGFSKTSVGGLGIIVVLLMALAFDAKTSVGILLPMLIVADAFAVFYYKKDCDYTLLKKIFPTTAMGVVVGYFIMDNIDKDIFEKTLGFVILLMLLLGYYLENKTIKPYQNNIILIVVGLGAGIATMLANAAGPLLAIYFLQLGLNKNTFVGTRSMYFLILNLFKLPFSIGLGLITFETLTINMYFVPVIVLGAFLGVKFLKMINMSIFKTLIRFASVVVALKFLLF